MLPFLVLVGLSSVALTVMANPRVLVFTATTGYRHDSIPTAIQVLGDLANQWNITFDFTECVDSLMTIQRLEHLECRASSNRA